MGRDFSVDVLGIDDDAFRQKDDWRSIQEVHGGRLSAMLRPAILELYGALSTHLGDLSEA